MKTKTQKRRPKKKNRNLGFAIASVLILALFIFVYVLSNQSMWGGKAKTENTKVKPAKEVFKLEANLQFWDADSNVVAGFAVEIADDAYSREKGMMYRHYIPDTVGMLFIFPGEERRSFWMKNTPSSLDIIYADDNCQIVRIHQNTEPYSLAGIPSGEKAKYVIEFKAGTIARYQIKEGYTFDYRLY